MKKNIKLTPNNSFTEFLLYTTPNGKVKLEIFLRDENVWLTQDKIAQLFGVQRPAISKHLKNIFETGELQEELVSSILEHTTRNVKLPFYQSSSWGNYSVIRNSRIAEINSMNMQNQLFESDFDKLMKKELGGGEV